MGDRQEDVRVPARNDFQRASGAANPWNKQTISQANIIASASFRLTIKFQNKINPI